MKTGFTDECYDCAMDIPVTELHTTTDSSGYEIQVCTTCLEFREDVEVDYA